jgi:flagellar biosynthetic protein FliS
MRGLQQYKTTAIETAPNETLLLLLLEKAIDRQDLAIEAIERSDKVGSREHLAFTREVFSELILSLDKEAAPELSNQLNRLYMWCIRELARAGSQQDPELVRGVRKVTVSLLETWTEAIEAAG